MISDNTLYSLAVFLGSLAMLLIVLYHFLEVNAVEEQDGVASSTSKSTTSSGAAGKTQGGLGLGEKGGKVGFGGNFVGQAQGAGVSRAR